MQQINKSLSTFLYISRRKQFNNVVDPYISINLDRDQQKDSSTMQQTHTSLSTQKIETSGRIAPNLVIHQEKVRSIMQQTNKSTSTLLYISRNNQTCSGALQQQLESSRRLGPPCSRPINLYQPCYTSVEGSSSTMQQTNKSRSGLLYFIRPMNLYQPCYASVGGSSSTMQQTNKSRSTFLYISRMNPYKHVVDPYSSRQRPEEVLCTYISLYVAILAGYIS